MPIPTYPLDSLLALAGLALVVLALVLAHVSHRDPVTPRRAGHPMTARARAWRAPGSTIAPAPGSRPQPAPAAREGR